MVMSIHADDQTRARGASVRLSRLLLLSAAVCALAAADAAPDRPRRRDQAQVRQAARPAADPQRQILHFQNALRAAAQAALLAGDAAGREAAWAKVGRLENRFFTVLENGAAGNPPLDAAGRAAAKKAYYAQAAKTIRQALPMLADAQAKAFFEGKAKDYEALSGGAPAPARAPAAPAPRLAPAKIDASAIAPQKVYGKQRAHVCRDLIYGPRQPGSGAAHADVAQTYDLYLPAAAGKYPSDAPFLVYIHGGAWSGGKKSDVATVCADLAENGLAVMSVNYALDNRAKGGAHTFADMLRDIDLAVAHVPRLAQAAGLEVSRIAVGGSSAGGHLALLYAYDAATPARLDLGLAHTLPVACVFSDCGPTDLASPEFAVAGMESVKMSFAECAGTINLLCGGARANAPVQAVIARATRHSPVALVSPSCPPTILLYCESARIMTEKPYLPSPGQKDKEPYAALWRTYALNAKVPANIGTDGIVAVQNFHALTNRLTAAGVPCDAQLAHYPHCQALPRSSKARQWLADALKARLAAPTARQQ